MGKSFTFPESYRCYIIWDSTGFVSWKKEDKDETSEWEIYENKCQMNRLFAWPNEGNQNNNCFDYRIYPCISRPFKT